MASLRIEELKLFSFKNYRDSKFSFRESVVAICGANGTGKTNILDALHHLCFTKSYFPGSVAMHFDETMHGWRVEAIANINEQRHKVVCMQPIQGKKNMLWNDVAYTRLSDHIGILPAVIIAPDDIALINEGSETRRAYLDALISQTDADYLQQLITYQHQLQQRNALLKSGYVRTDLLEVYDSQLAACGQAVFGKRKDVTAELFPLIEKYYRLLSNDKEKINWEYKSALHENTLELILKNKRESDLYQQRTTEGVHRDDLLAFLNGQPFRQTASQGQKKSLLFAMKMASFDFIQKKKNTAPLLMLDDVFEKLDTDRINRLLTWVKQQNNTQVFITDTHKERVKKSFEEIGIEGEIIEL
jgi:DNA replication and repair protein RecF